MKLITPAYQSRRAPICPVLVSWNAVHGRSRVTARLPPLALREARPNVSPLREVDGWRDSTDGSGGWWGFSR